MSDQFKLSNWLTDKRYRVFGQGGACQRSSFTGEPLVPADEGNTIDGYRLSAYQARIVRDKMARVHMRHVTTGDIVARLPNGRIMHIPRKEPPAEEVA